MAFASDSTTAPARPLLPLPALDRRAIGRDGWARARDLASRLGGEIRAHLAEGLRQAWAAARRLLSSAPPATHAISATVAARPASVDATLLPSSAPLPAAVARRRAIFGSVVPCIDPSVAPPPIAAPDPAFAAVAKFDRVVAEWDGAFGEFLGIMDALDPDGCACWDDPQAVARVVLGPVAGSTVAALDGLLRRMEALDVLHEAAEARLLSTRPASEIEAAALRAAVRRYARRPFGWMAEESIMLERLAA